MELVFENQTIDFLRQIVSKTVTQEQTQELIVPDSYPDCARIVFTGANALVRGKECRDGSMTLTGGVRAGVLYIPEDGTQPRALECYIPYAFRVDDAQATAQMQLCAGCRVKSADARLINSRKILVRVNLVCELTGYTPASQTIPRLTQAPDQLQTKTAQYRLVLPQEYTEKSFAMSEDLEIPASEPQMEKIVQYWVSPEISEQKLVGNKAVFKGTAGLKILFLTPDGSPAVYERQLPFSQYCELQSDEDDREAQLQLCVTGSELELVQTDEGGKLLVSLNLLCQCLTFGACEVTLTQDAYATRGSFTPQWSEIALCSRLDRQTMYETLRGSVPAQARAVIDSTIYLDAPAQQKTDGAVQFTAPATVNILYYDADGALQSAIVRDQAVCTMAAEHCAVCQARVQPGRDGYAAPSGGGMDVRYEVSFDISCCCEQTLRALAGGTLEEGGEKTAEKFCVIVKTNPKTQSIWELAKEYRTTQQAIAQANNLTTDEAEQGMLLLIPV